MALSFADSSGSGDNPATAVADLFWPQGDPPHLREAAAAWRRLARHLDQIAAESHDAARAVTAGGSGPAIDAFATCWQRWDGPGGYLHAATAAAGQLADALDRYADAIDSARRRIEELAATAGTVVAVGVVLTVATVGISDLVAGGVATGLLAAAAEIGIELSAEIAEIAGALTVSAAAGALEGVAADSAIQVERIVVFQDQQTFDLSELGQSAAFGAATAGLGVIFGSLGRLGSRLLPDLADVSPTSARVLSSFADQVKSGLAGMASGAILSAASDELTTGRVDLLDVGGGAATGALGGVVAGGTIARLRRRESREVARDLHGRATAAEPSITADIDAVMAETGGTPAGRAHVLKSPESLARKIEADAVDRVAGAASVGQRINDVVRYTITYPVDGHTAAVQHTLASLNDRGYVLQRFKNAWQVGNGYKGINTVLRHPGGQSIELQFHTPASYAVKDQTHGDYGVVRTSRSLSERQTAFDRMMEKSAGLVHPPGIEHVGQPVHYRRP